MSIPTHTPLRHATGQRLPAHGAVSALVLSLSLSACGQAGALYLPDQAPPKHSTSLRPDAHKPADDPLAKRGSKSSTTKKPSDTTPATTATDSSTPAANNPVPDAGSPPDAATPTATPNPADASPVPADDPGASPGIMPPPPTR